ncbi:MAG: MmcQ/YjbR family DNA-binding protein [Chitinophagaceae bacterium]
MALSFPDSSEQPHFKKISFRKKKKIFATLTLETGIAVVKLTLVDQSVFCAFDEAIIYPMPNAWGKQGWTCVVLKKIKKAMLLDILTTAYQAVK